MSFGDFVNAGGFNQKMDQVGLSLTSKSGPIDTKPTPLGLNPPSKTNEMTPHWMGPLVGSANPTSRLADPPGHLVVLEDSTAFKDQSPPFIKVGLIGRSRFGAAMDPWTHRVPGAPYKRTPRSPAEKHLIQIKTHQEE